MKVLGVSGSAIKNSNTDRAVKHVLDATGLETEFVKLSDYKVAPCTACLGCVYTNRCVIQDDGIMLAEKARDADALVIGGYTSYSSINSITKAFIERLYSLRHITNLMKGKPGAAVVTFCAPEANKQLPPAAEMGVNSVKFYMMEEGMRFVGGLKVTGNVPCVNCGRPGEKLGDQCKISGHKMLFGPEATLAGIGINDVDKNQPLVLKQAIDLGQKIAEALKGS